MTRIVDRARINRAPCAGGVSELSRILDSIKAARFTSSQINGELAPGMSLERGG